MDNFESRKAEALQLLAASGLMRSHYLPPATRLLWRMGMEAPPPHFVPFRRLATVAGIYFGVTACLCATAILWWLGSTPGLMLTGSALALASGPVFGMALAAVYARDRRRHRFPAWEELGRDASVA